MLIATDLDGTLVPREAERPSARTAAVLRLADEVGIPVVFVTARALRHLDGFWPYVGQHGRAIASNGAVTYDVHTSSVIHHIGLDPGRGLEIMSAIAQQVPEAAFAIECLDGIRIGTGYLEPHSVPIDTPRGDLRELWRTLALKLLVRSRDPAPDGFEGIRERVVAAVEDTATCTWSTPGLVEISARDVTKATALAELCSDLNVAQDDVIAFGDMPNDLPMLEWAGTSYAVGDAHPDVVAAVDHVVAASERDGVAWVMERLIGRDDR